MALYVQFAWAALRPPRAAGWEKHAQERSDGYLSPPNFTPNYPEPKKWYKRRPGSEYAGSTIHPTDCHQLRMLVRLSDALSEAAVDTTQDWFMVALTIDPASPTDTVGDLLTFATQLVGSERLRPGQLSISAGLPNPRLWKNSTPPAHFVEVSAHSLTPSWQQGISLHCPCHYKQSSHSGQLHE